MTTSQKLDIDIDKNDKKKSELRQRLNELSAKEKLADGEQAKIDELSAELSEKETQYRASLDLRAAARRQRAKKRRGPKACSATATANPPRCVRCYAILGRRIT